MRELGKKYAGECILKDQITYRAENPNGVLFILKEPGGNEDEGSDWKENIKGNYQWFLEVSGQIGGVSGEKLTSAKKGVITKTRNRFLELLSSCLERDCTVQDLQNCHYTNITFEHRGRSESNFCREYCDDERVYHRVDQIIKSLETCHTVFLITKVFKACQDRYKAKIVDDTGFGYEKKDQFDPIQKFTIKYQTCGEGERREITFCSMRHPVRSPRISKKQFADKRRNSI